MRFCGAILSLALALVPAAAAAQSTEETQTRRIQAQRLPSGDAVRIDGNPDEPFWQQVAPATDFLQREPSTGAPATERTEVKVAYDEERLILAVICHVRTTPRGSGWTGIHSVPANSPLSASSSKRPSNTVTR